MARMAAFHLTVVANKEIEAAFRQHFGARRVAYNKCLEVVKDALDARQKDDSVIVPWSRFDLINAFNAWKRSEQAGRRFAVDRSGQATLVDQGLSWRSEVCAQVFEEGAQDLGRALAAFSAARRGERREVGFPHFQKLGRNDSFRLRNKVSKNGRHTIRVGEQNPRSVTLPVIGAVPVREDTRRLRRLLREGPQGKPRGRICYATVAVKNGRFVLTLTCELADFHEKRRHASEQRSFIGIDRGLSSLLVLGDANRNELGRIAPPKHLDQELVKIRRQSRACSRKVLGSSNRKKAARRLARLHAKVVNRRADFTHRISSEIAKSHGALCLEQLAVGNLTKNRHLSRAIGDAAWGELANQLSYKARWYGATLHIAPRFFPSTRTCSSWVS